MPPRAPLLHAATAALLVACSGDNGVCGDHVVDPGEACDAAGDGCDAACHLTGATTWTVTRGATNKITDLLDVAVDPDGQIVVLGVSSDWATGEPVHAAWLLALDPAGAEQWQADIPLSAIEFNPGPPKLAVDAGGFIYIQGRSLQRFGPLGEPSWQLAPEDRAFTALTVVDGAVYATGFEISSDGSDNPDRYKFAVHRHDAATGASVWERVLGDDDADYVGVGLAVRGDTVYAAGRRSPHGDGFPHPVHVTLDAASGDSGPLVVDDAEEAWTAFAGGPSGDLVVTGETPEGRFVRRFARDGTARWTHALDTSAPYPAHLEIGADESVVFAGPSLAGPRALIQGLTSAGEPAFLVEPAPARPDSEMRLAGLAFGPGFLVAVGVEARKDNWDTGWITKIGPGPGPDDGSTTGDTTGEPAVPDSVLECAQPAPCGRVEAFAGCPGDPTPAAYTAAQTCALEAFAAGDPVRIAQFDGCDFGYGKLLLVRDDASVIVQHFESAPDGVDLEGVSVSVNSFFNSELCTLKPAAFFTDCLATFDINCATSSEWVEACDAPAPAACEP